jgi:nicotinamidase/pyrazinamidase
MAIIKKIAAVIAIIIIIFVALAFAGMYITGKPTQGTKIRAYAQPRKALLVIDIQEDYTGTSARPSSPYLGEAPAVIARVNGVIDAAIKKDMVIVYIRQEFEGFAGKAFSMLIGGATLKGTPGAALDKRVMLASKNNLTKPKGDAFTNPQLDALLISNRVNEIYLTGLDAAYCVHSTARGALNRGYRVNIITDAIMLGSKKKWDALLETYRKEGIRLLTCSEL